MPLLCQCRRTANPDAHIPTATFEPKSVASGQASLAKDGCLALAANSLRIMKDDEERHACDLGAGDLGQPQAVFEHSRPMPDAMVAVERQGVLVENCFEQAGNVERHARARFGYGGHSLIFPSMRCISASSASLSRLAVSSISRAEAVSPSSSSTAQPDNSLRSFLSGPFQPPT